MPCVCRGRGKQCERCKSRCRSRDAKRKGTALRLAGKYRYRHSEKGRECARFWVRSRRSALRILENRI